MKQLFIIPAMMLLIITSAYALETDLLSTIPSPITAGEYADVTLRLTTTSQQAVQQNVLFGVEENDYITVLTPPRSYQSLRPGDQVTATFRVYIQENTPEGYINLLSTVQVDGVTAVEEHELFVQGAARQVDLRIGSTTSTPQQLLPDSKRNELTITLQNLGEQTAELVSAELILEQGATPSYAYSLQDSVSSIEDGAQAPLTFTFDIDEEARGEIPAQLRAEYRTRQDSQAPITHMKILPLRIPIDSAPYMRVTAQELLTESTQGSSDNVLRITLTNEGEEEATDVRVRLFPDVSYPFIFERTSQYVGAMIPPGGSTTLDITYEVTSSADVRDYETAIEIESLVSTSRYTQEDTITISVAQGSELSTQAIAGILIGVIVILAAIIGIVRRRSKS